MFRRRASALLFLLLILPSCQRSPAAHEGPIVLITFDSLRADVVGGLGGRPGLMPHLEALLGQADWGGRAVASSSWGAPAMASLFTGLSPWQHQVLWAGHARLSPALFTLPEALKARGYETAGYPAGPWASRRLGYAQGFDAFAGLDGANAAERLERLGKGRTFVWIHIPQPQVPWIRRDRLISRLGPNPPQLPVRIMPRQLEPFFDPAVPLPPGRRRRFEAMYRLNAAWADERFGRLLEALRESGQWDRTLLVVTSSHGEELGEKGQILTGGNLGRQLLEVPLAVKLPAGFDRRIEPPETRRVAAARIWATLVEAAGGDVPPAVAPSLLRPAPEAVLSELYLTNGTNQFSLVEGEDQLLWESRFAPPDPGYYTADVPEAARSQGKRLSASSIPSAAALARLLGSFEATPPLAGQGAPHLTLERWEERGSREVKDPRRTEELARRLVRMWGAFSPGDVPPGEEAREWYTGKPP